MTASASLRRALVALVPALLSAAVAWHLAAPVEDEAAIDVEAGRYAVDAGHSTVRFGIRHAGVANFYGRFNEMSGTYTIDDDPTQNSITFAVEAESVDSNSADRDAHLRNEDFFHVDKYPRMTFDSTSCEAAGPNAFRLKGDLTLRGETNEVEVDVTVIGAGKTMFRDYRSGVEARFSFDRNDFGITAYPGALGDEISVVVSLEGILQR